jgi:hypothetical protein
MVTNYLFLTSHGCLIPFVLDKILTFIISDNGILNDYGDQVNVHVKESYVNIYVHTYIYILQAYHSKLNSDIRTDANRGV